MTSPDEVFHCQKCGHCCEGKGGIVLSDKDLSRLAAFLAMEVELVLQNYTELSNGKIKIKSGANGFCIFYVAGTGCAIHAGKPDICRAWPWFRGNLEDPISLEMAKEFCPGIKRNLSFEEFARVGKHALENDGLVAKAGEGAANSLVIKINYSDPDQALVE